METKEQILKRAYEAHFSSQKYEKSNFGHTYKAVSESAMDEWARQQAVEFWKYCIGNNYRLTLAADEIYNSFLQSIQP